MSQYASVVKLDYDPNVYSSDESTSNPFVRRIDCWQDTRRLCEELYNEGTRPPPSVKVTDWDSHRMHEFIKQRTWRQQNGQWSPREPTVDFLNQDAIDVALDLLSTGKSLRPLVLNLADDIFAGGCVNQGSGAQEESLFRRTNYYQTLVNNSQSAQGTVRSENLVVEGFQPSEQDDALYPIENGEAVYSPEVTILKSSEETGWQVYPVDQRPVLAFVACPGLKYPEWIVDEYGEHRLTSEDVQILKEKIGVIIQVAVQYKHDAIVLGALGCGAWRNPIKHVAEIFKSVLDAYEGLVPYVVFAILSTTDGCGIRSETEDTHAYSDERRRSLSEYEHYNIVRSREKNSKKSTCEIFQEVFGHDDA